ncbi:tannase and feruloyl esterase [Mycena rebaudengoi]|nr:tannase and feruloyl esterase [Mycena rebaudengoi]
MHFTVQLLSQLFLGSGVLTSNAGALHAKCLSLKSSLDLENTTIVDVSYLSAGGKLVPGTHGQCPDTAFDSVSVPLCRVQFFTNTSESSVVYGEAWLPDEWHGRFLGAGNGGLGGCIFYDTLDYGSSLHFASVGSNNGHDGDTGLPFLGQPEVINDFAHRAIHVEALIGKQIVEAYYGRPHDKSYFLGCSTGGRQGTQEALKYPEDFDGIVAGAPGTNFNHLMHSMAMVARRVGAPSGAASPTYLSPALWKVVAEEVLNQCDALDGVRDGIIDEPDACDFRPEVLICRGDDDAETCLTPPQVDALRLIYSPLYADGELHSPRFDPGAEASSFNSFVFGGVFPFYPEHWLKYTVLNVTDFDMSKYGPEQGILFDQVNPGGIATFDGDLSAFRDRGGKFLTYHGRRDTLIPSGNSKRVYNLISRTLRMPSLDAFYRLFLVPGMDHCAGGPGAWRFGQFGNRTNAVSSSSHNILLALVDWVEGGVAPDTIVGTAEDGSTREHCRYPLRSVWNGDAFVCGK